MGEDLPPAAILEKHPELISIGEALAQRKRGEPITARCIKCGLVLEVVEIEVTGVTIVRCATGDTFFRAVHKHSSSMP
jgi:hypothetical protein